LSGRAKRATRQAVASLRTLVATQAEASGEQLAEHLMAPAGEAVEQVTETAAEGKQAVADTARGRRRERGDSSSGGGHRVLRGDR
jgi:hypothetical protein